MSKTGFLLIADISGYTEFVKLHNIRKKPILGNVIANNFQSHAETIISDLLESVIDSIEPKMKLNKLEGDAAFFFCEKNNSKYESDKIIEFEDIPILSNSFNRDSLWLSSETPANPKPKAEISFKGILESFEIDLKQAKQ